MSLVSKLKKSLLILSIPAAISCSSIKFANIEQYRDDMYPSDKIIRVETSNTKLDISPRNQNPEYYAQKKGLESKIDNNIRENNWINSNYGLSWSFDSDGDGITNWNDPWPYVYGPVIDTNLNGKLDFTDMQISGFGNYRYNSFYFGSSHYGYSGFTPFYGNYGSNFYPHISYGYYPIIYNTYENNGRKIVYGKRPSRSSDTNNNLQENNRSRNNNFSNDRNNPNENNINRPRNRSGREGTIRNSNNEFNNNQNNSNNNFNRTRQYNNQNNNSNDFPSYRNRQDNNRTIIPSQQPVQRSTPTRKRD